ncbi:hypothetical protein HK100_000133 [Physocladia obscura]|uniref:Uncharacterized protein n=1 Tax=Physocladia obscura TaxID=109957 RepID=A0AAD5XJX2_9FUNG|nr:hypothetical protein HK100_000133 [Physocladia obscura]
MGLETLTTIRLTPLQIGIIAAVGVAGLIGWLTIPKALKFDPRGTIDLSGKVVLITGGSAGIGKVNVRQFAELGAKVYVIARNRDKTERVIEEIKARTGNKNIFFINGDLDKLETISAAAKEFLAKESKLHILVCNAGSGGRNKNWTSNGFEVLFGQNYLAHFLLTIRLLDCLKTTANSLKNTPGAVRIVNVSSAISARGASLIDFTSLVQKNNDPNDIEPFFTTDFSSYGRSKLCQVLSTIKLSQVLKDSGISAYSLHPGVVASDIWNIALDRVGIQAAFIFTLKSFVMITEEQGSLTTLYCSVSKNVANQSGLYYSKCTVRENKNKAIKNQAQIDELWEKSMEWIKNY